MGKKVFIGILAAISFNVQLSAQQSKALNSRSDSLDIFNYQINLDLTDFGSRIIKGDCKILFAADVDDLGYIALDLLKLTVDSVVTRGVSLNYSYNDTLLQISLKDTLQTDDVDSVTVYYHGSPTRDPSWGGFYFDNLYAYNLGVGINSEPHNMGRVWFPCIDNFIERSTYEFNITTSVGRKAHCNGELISETIISGDTILRSWKMEEEIPTYLACIAVSDYETVYDSYQGLNGSIPVELVSREADTTNLKNSFVHLSDALTIYEENYGPYLWNKIGYSIVPFTAGAMEHASNIAYPRNAINGTTQRETLMAHEFAHHWWGDLVTCETSADMWINEGMASYSEHLFLEKLYGDSAYYEAVKANHRDILQFAHIRDGDYLALSGVTQTNTYGTHTYNKGASVAHNMRAYMGDSLFFVGLKSITDTFKFRTVNAEEFRDQLERSTGVDMANFFDSWIFVPGYAHYKIDSAIVTPNGANFDTQLYLQQKLKGATNFHKGTPVEISFYDANWNREIETIVVSGQQDDTTLTLPFDPILILLNERNRLNQARTDDQLLVNTTGTYALESSLAEITIDAINDSALLQVEHHWVAPDPIQNNTKDHKLSKNRYWSVEGILPSTFDASMSIDYDGRAGLGFLDEDLVGVRGDSLILLYRRDAHEDWSEFSYYTKSSRAPSSKNGTITIDSLILGEYSFANKGSLVSLSSNVKAQDDFSIYPNPTETVLWVKNKTNKLGLTVIVYDGLGRKIYEEGLSANHKIATSNWKRGSYIIVILDKNQELLREKVIVK